MGIEWFIRFFDGEDVFILNNITGEGVIKQIRKCQFISLFTRLYCSFLYDWKSINRLNTDSIITGDAIQNETTWVDSLMRSNQDSRHWELALFTPFSCLGIQTIVKCFTVGMFNYSYAEACIKWNTPALLWWTHTKVLVIYLIIFTANILYSFYKLQIKSISDKNWPNCHC